MSDFCPFKGLQPYTETDREYFFGRERDEAVIASNLYAAPLTVLYGASGVGKSSVLLAGVVPRLKADPQVSVVVFRTWQATSYQRALKLEVLRALGNGGQPPNIDPALPLDEFLLECDKALPFRGRIFFIFDQFEEYFLRFADSEAPDKFDAEFARAVNRREIPANFLLSLRDDGLSKLDRFQGRIPNVLGNLLRVKHLSFHDAQMAIRKPLEIYNAQRPRDQQMLIEDSLVEAVAERARIANDAGHAAVGETIRDAVETPVLQILLTRLWKTERERSSHQLRMDTFKSLGGAEYIIFSYLKDVMDSLTDRERTEAAQALPFLLTATKTKVPQQSNSLAAWAKLDKHRVQSLLDRLSAGEDKVLRKVQVAGQPVQYEIFHDVLGMPISRWCEDFLHEREVEAAAERAAAEAAAEAKENERRLRIETAEALAAKEAQRAKEAHQRAEAERQRREEQELRVKAERERTESERQRAKERADAQQRETEQALLFATSERQRAEERADARHREAEQALLFAKKQTRAVRIMRSLSLALGVLLVLAVFTTAFAIIQSRRARQNAALATENARKEAIQRERAEQQRRAAYENALQALAEKAKADEATKKAIAQTRVAEVARSEAQIQKEIAEDAAVKERAARNQVVTALQQARHAQELAEKDALTAIEQTRIASFARSIAETIPYQRLVFSPDAKLFALASEPLRIQETATGRQVAEFPAAGFARFSPDGLHIATISRGRVLLWSIKSPSQPLMELQEPMPNPESTSNVSFTPDGKYILATGASGWRLWDLESGRLISRLQLQKTLYASAISPDSKLIATSDFTGKVRFWDYLGKQQRCLEYDSAEPNRILEIQHLLFLPDGKTILVEGESKVQFWGLENRNCVGNCSLKLKDCASG